MNYTSKCLADQRDELIAALGAVFKLLPDYAPRSPNWYIVEDARKAFHKAQGN